MTPALSPFFRDSSFDPFLFASVGEERNGMMLSVVSALARLDLDPWSEAASLSRLTTLAATERLTTLLSSSPTGQFRAPASATIMRLVGLLPKGARDATRSRAGAFVTKPKMSRPAVGLIILAFVMMFAQQFAGRREPKGPTGGLASPAASVTDPSAAKARGE